MSHLRRMETAACATDVRGNPHIAVIDLDGRVGHSRPDLGVCQRVRRRVVIVVNLDVIVDVHAPLLPDAVDEALRWQRAQRRTVGALEEDAAGYAVDPHHSIVEVGRQFGDALVERVQAAEGLVAEVRQNPPLGDLHGDLDLGLVARMQRARRQDGRAVVRRQLLVGALDARLVPARRRHAALELVGHDRGRQASEDGSEAGSRARRVYG